MANFPGQTAAPTFATPLEMLRACHGRILDQCNTLLKLKQHLDVRGCDVQAQQAAQAILRYFDTAGQYHHQDEELDLFPLLLASTNTTAHELVRHLLGDHQAMNEAWLLLRPRLQDITQGIATPLEARLVADFNTAYAQHISLENSQLLPLAAQLLDEQQISELGDKMARRRGAEFKPP
jgi:hemerythrin-like domain-containing protein